MISRKRAEDLVEMNKIVQDDYLLYLINFSDYIR